MLFVTLLFLFQFHQNHCQLQASINHGFLKHLIPVKPIGPTDVHRQGYFHPYSHQILPPHLAGPAHLIPFQPQQQPPTLNPPFGPQFVNELWSLPLNKPLTSSPFQAPLGQEAIFGPSSPNHQNSLSHFGIPGNELQFSDTSNTKFLNGLMNRTISSGPIALLITGKSKKGKGLLRNVLLHVDLDESEISALKPDVFENLQIFSPYQSKWHRMMAERVLKKFKSSFNLVLVRKPPRLIDLFERREEKMWSGHNSEALKIDVQDIINPRKK